MTADAALMPVNMMWIGARLGPIERLSLISFKTLGHPVRLYVYGDVGNVPPGVETIDARTVLPLEVVEANRYANGSYALASNLFRYALMKTGAGLWADIDVVCVRPIPGGSQVVVGWENDASLNGAVLYFSPALAIVDDALAAFRMGYLPPWLPLRKSLRARLRRAAGLPFGPRDLPHGTFGPKAVTALVKRHHLDHLAQPPDVFYPLRPRQARAAFDAGLTLKQVLTPRTQTIHLWNEKISDLKNTAPRRGSVLHALFDRYGL